jgi:hypothetical protein
MGIAERSPDNAGSSDYPGIADLRDHPAGRRVTRRCGVEIWRISGANRHPQDRATWQPARYRAVRVSIHRGDRTGQEGLGRHYLLAGRGDGQGRTTGKESIGPSYTKDASMFASKDDVTQQISFPESLTLGGESYKRRKFTPGLPLAVAGCQALDRPTSRSRLPQSACRRS